MSAPRAGFNSVKGLGDFLSGAATSTAGGDWATELASRLVAAGIISLPGPDTTPGDTPFDSSSMSAGNGFVLLNDVEESGYLAVVRGDYGSAVAGLYLCPNRTVTVGADGNMVPETASDGQNLYGLDPAGFDNSWRKIVGTAKLGELLVVLAS